MALEPPLLWDWCRRYRGTGATAFVALELRLWWHWSHRYRGTGIIKLEPETAQLESGSPRYDSATTTALCWPGSVISGLKSRYVWYDMLFCNRIFVYVSP